MARLNGRNVDVLDSETHRGDKFVKVQVGDETGWIAGDKVDE